MSRASIVIKKYGKVEPEGVYLRFREEVFFRLFRCDCFEWADFLCGLSHQTCNHLDRELG